MGTKTNVIIQLQVEGLHCFPGVESIPGLEEVRFLKDLHRHMWHITLKKQVTHSDRDVEFIVFKRDVIQYLKNRYYRDDYRTHLFGAKSCEMLAEELLTAFDCVYVSVFEDNENGAECMV